MSFWGYFFSLLFSLRSFLLEPRKKRLTGDINRRFDSFPLCVRAGGTAVPGHPGLHDGSGGDRGPGADLPGHIQTPARRLRPHAGHRPVRLPPPRSTAQGLPACPQGKAWGGWGLYQRITCTGDMVVQYDAEHWQERFHYYHSIIMYIIDGLLVFVFPRDAERWSFQPTLPRHQLQSLGSNMLLTLGWWNPSASIQVKS